MLGVLGGGSSWNTACLLACLLAETERRHAAKRGGDSDAEKRREHRQAGEESAQELRTIQYSQGEETVYLHYNGQAPRGDGWTIRRRIMPPAGRMQLLFSASFCLALPGSACASFCVHLLSPSP